MSNRHVIRKWNRWLERIRNELVTLAEHREIYRRVRKIVLANPRIQTSDPLHEFLIRGYVAYTSISIRRLTDIHKKSISLAGLLVDIFKHSDALTRHRMRLLYQNNRLPRRIADEHMDSSGRMGIRRIKKSSVRSDLASLKTATNRVRKYVNKIMAHSSRRGPRTLPTHLDLDLAIDKLEDIAKTYIFIVDGSAQIKFLPTLPPETLGTLKIPWVLPTRHSVIFEGGVEWERQRKQKGGVGSPWL